MRLVDDEKWAPVIGHFMLAFGSIESSVNRLLQHWCSLRTLLFVRSTITLEQRIKLVKSLVEEQDLGASNRAILIANLNDVKALAATRNLIAHSPLTLLAFHSEPEDERGLPPLREVILSARDEEKHVSYDELHATMLRAKRMAQVMMQNQLEIGWHGRRITSLSEEPHVAVLERA